MVMMHGSCVYHQAKQREAECAVAAEEEAAIDAMAQLIVSDEPFMEKKSTFQVGPED